MYDHGTFKYKMHTVPSVQVFKESNLITYQEQNKLLMLCDDITAVVPG